MTPQPPRISLSPPEVEDLLGALEGRLHTVGIKSQPEVAAKIVNLVADPDAGLRQYADVIKADPALSGRLLRLANSAFFAQREPITGLDRACVLLGLDRLKAVSLGFHLSRGTGAGRKTDLSRRIWGESVYRACLAAELSRNLCPGFASEAFVIGLMLDCGVPILCDLLGSPAESIVHSGRPPLQQFQAELETLPFTHVDVAVVLARRWRLPELLARPIERQHTPPADGTRADPVHLLHRVAYYVGALHINSAASPARPVPALAAQNSLGLNGTQLDQIVARAGQEHSTISDMFSEVAASLGDVDGLADRVQGQLVELLDQVMMTQISGETRQTQGVFTIADQHIEIETGRSGVAVAYLVDVSGERLLSYVFRPGSETVATILEALGLDNVRPAETTDLDQYLRSLAA